MGVLVVQDTVDKVRLDLVDESAVTWTDADLIEDYNEAIRAIVAARPDTHALTEYIPLTDGTTQSLPAGGTALFDVTENQASKRRVTQVDLELLDETYRFWPAGVEAVDVKHFCADPRDKTQFRVYPPNTGYGSVLATYAAVPAAVSYLDVNPLADIYEPAIVQYMLAAAYRRNTQRQDLGKTQGYMQMFATSLGLNAQSQAAVAPRVRQSPGA